MAAEEVIDSNGRVDDDDECGDGGGDGGDGGKGNGGNGLFSGGTDGKIDCDTVGNASTD